MQWQYNQSMKPFNQVAPRICAGAVKPQALQQVSSSSWVAARDGAAHFLSFSTSMAPKVTILVPAPLVFQSRQGGTMRAVY